ncbi:MAG: hypothetical protein JXN10_02005 [Clostridia bacterium]|nr:hypothetical protein [Clostridia bacterium]MBN2882271.1 hypothetical protein [Clostridia bacterium]
MTGKVFKSIMIVLFCIMIAVFLAIFLFGYLKGYSAKYIYKKLVPGSVEGIYKAVKIIENDGYEVFESASDGKYVYILEDDDIAVYDTGNEDVTYISPEYNQPVLTSQIYRVMVYDKSTGSYTLLEDGKAAGNGSLEKKCLGATLLSNGFVGFVMPGGDGFRGSYIILDDELKKVVEYSYSDRYPVSGCVSEDAAYFAVVGIKENHAGKTSIDIYRAGEENPVSGKNIDYLAPMIVSFGRNSFATCGTGSIDIFSFSENTHAGITSENVIIVRGTNHGLYAVTGGTGWDTLLKINEKGDIVWERNIPAGTQGIEISQDHIFYWNKTEMGVFGTDGTAYEIQGDTGSVSKILVLGTYRIAAVTDSRIILYEFN